MTPHPRTRRTPPSRPPSPSWATDAQDPVATAARIINGFERDQLHILTHPDMAFLVRERLHQLEAALRAAEAAEGEPDPSRRAQR